MLVLIWIQTVCKSYQQTTKDSKERVKSVRIQIRTDIMSVPCSVRPDLGPNCLPRLSAEKKSLLASFIYEHFGPRLGLTNCWA